MRREKPGGHVSKAIARQEVQALMRSGAQLVEVLPNKEYQDIHLPGAVNIPLTKLDRQSTAGLAPAQAVIVYCYDYQ
jgi:rhodanese-related sulfurtransferase